MKTSTLLIRTPEGIVFAQLLAGPVSRFLAWVVDLGCIVVINIIVNAVIGLVMFVSPDLASGLYTIGFFVISVGYGIVFEWVMRGQTIGKKFFRLRVVDVEGLRLQFNQIVTRNLLRFVDSLPAFYFVGGLACWLSPKCQRLGDIAANTTVIRVPRIAEPDLDQMFAGKFNSLRQHPHLAARLRQLVTPPEAVIALSALIRRDEFDPMARVELFSELASHFQSKVTFPAEATDGVADEQFIRNVVDVIFRGRPEEVTNMSAT